MQTATPKLPSHPGLLLRDTILPSIDLSVSQAARDLLITRQTLHRILAGQASITPDMAVRLEKLCGVASGFWLNKQQKHELERVMEANKFLLPRIPSHLVPASALQKIGMSDDDYK